MLCKHTELRYLLYSGKHHILNLIVWKQSSSSRNFRYTCLGIYIMETISSIVHPCDDVQELLIRLIPLYLFLNGVSHHVQKPVSLDFFLTLSVKLFISSRIYYTRINLKFSGKCLKFLWSFKSSSFIVTTAALCVIVMVPPLHWFIAGQRHKLFIVGSSDHTFIHGCGRPKNRYNCFAKAFSIIHFNAINKNVCLLLAYFNLVSRLYCSIYFPVSIRKLSSLHLPKYGN